MNGPAGILPEEAWSPLAVLVKTPQLLEVEGGVVKIPTAPGLGIEVDDEAVERFRARLAELGHGPSARPGYTDAGYVGNPRAAAPRL